MRSFSSKSSCSWTFKSIDSRIKQSAGTLEPVSRRITSPTTRFQTLDVKVDPSLPLITVTFSSKISPYKATYYLSFFQSANEVIKIRPSVEIMIERPSPIPLMKPVSNIAHVPESAAETIRIRNVNCLTVWQNESMKLAT